MVHHSRSPALLEVNGLLSSHPLVIRNRSWHICLMSRRSWSTTSLHVDDGPPLQSLGVWLQKNMRWLTAQLRSRDRSPEDIDDLISRAVLRVAESFDRGATRNPSAVAAMLVRTVFRLASNDRRDRSRHPIDPNSIDELPLIDPALAPEELVDMQQSWELIESVLKTVEPRARESFLLSRVHGMSYPQIAQQLHVSVRTVEEDVTWVMRVMLDERHRRHRRRA